MRSLNPVWISTLNCGRFFSITQGQWCHTDRVGAEKILPAYRLKEMAAGMPSDEFLARLLSGVRGTSDTALANPLSLGDIRGLLRLYQEDAVD